MNIRYLAALAAACSFSLAVSSQSLPNSILWRISGKDGRHTSYLYGSMHLTDDRIFNLGDSLYAAIANSDGLATELDPNDLLSLTIEQVEDQLTNGKDIKTILSAKDYKTYGPLLTKKFKKPVGEITTRDILKQKNKWIQDQYGKGGMATFLDMYLYEVARRQKKWTGGVEDAADQRGLLNAEETVDKSDIVDLIGKDRDGAISTELEKMISVYLKQDLSAIDTLFGDSPDKETVLLKRNRKMAGRMDSLSGVRSMVFVVGVAHLPGEEGLISLLRKKGFDVQPVFSSRKIKPADYPLPELSGDWERIEDENGFYRVLMPGKAKDIDLFHLVKMKLYFDFLDMDGYMVAAIPSAFRPSRTDSVMDAVADHFFEGDTKKSVGRIELSGTQGRVYTSLANENYKKGYFFLKDGIFYMAYGVAIRGTDKNKGSIDRFLKSFELLDRKKSDTGLAQIVVHTDTAMAFAVSTPGEARINTNASNGHGRSKIYLTTDLAAGVYYFFGTNQLPPDRYILNDSSFFQGLVKTVSAKMTGIDFDSSWVENDQLVTEVHGGVKGTDMEMVFRYIDRGNRWYSLLAMVPVSSDVARVSRFFSSFHELDYPAHTWTTATAPDSVFTSWTPAPFEQLPKDSTDGADIDGKYNSYDSTRAEGFSVIAYHLSPYYWSSSDSAFWAERIKAHLKYSDTLISKKAVSNGEAEGWELVKRGKRTHNYERLRMLRNGDELYSLYVAGPYKELYTDNAERFFSDFRFSRPVGSGRFFHSKAKQLIDDLVGPDSVVSSHALAYIGQAPWTRNELPLLHEALLHVSPIRGAKKWAIRVDDAIFNAVSRIKDTSSFSFAMEHYNAMPDSQYFVKNNLLDLMVLFPDSLRFRTMARALQATPPHHRLDGFFFRKLHDTLRLTATIAPQFLPLMNDTAVGPGFAPVLLRLLDSGWLGSGELLPYKDGILAYTRGIAQSLLADPDNYRYNQLDMIRLCGRFNDKAGNALMQQLLRVKSSSIAMAALEGLLTGKQPVDSIWLRPIAADKSYRLELFGLLEKANRTKLMPAAYRTQKALGQSEVYDYLVSEDDEDEDASINFLTSRTITTPRGKRNMLFYKYGSGDNVYLACAGPFDPDPAKLSTMGIHGDVYYKEKFDNSKLQEQIDALLKRFADDTEEP